MYRPDHEVYHKMSPKDFDWPTESKPVSFIQISRTVGPDEHWQVNVPMFETDDRETMINRCWMFSSVLQDRLDEVNETWDDLENKEKSQ